MSAASLTANSGSRKSLKEYRVTNFADRATLNKVPLVTLIFWVIKILATTVGETGADFLNFNLGFGLTMTSLVATMVLAACLALQFRQGRYVPWIYWLSVVFLSIVGTLLTDNMTDNLGISLYVSSAIFAVLLGVTFIAWYRSERTLSIHAITNRRREAYYWAAILFTFALGTAAGDLVSEQIGLGYALSGCIFGALIALITIAYYGFGLDSVTAFWGAYILTRPLGASIGDFLTQSAKQGGLGFSTMHVSELFLAVIIGLVIYLTVSSSDRAAVPPETA